jgi:hypothetical protein
MKNKAEDQAVAKIKFYQMRKDASDKRIETLRGRIVREEKHKQALDEKIGYWKSKINN